MSRASTADRARAIASEVATYRPDYDEQRECIADELSRKAAGSRNTDPRRRDIANLAFAALDFSHAVIKQADQRISPKGRVATLTRRTLAMTAFARTSLQPELDKALDDCCLGAELKFVHGLEHHRLKRRSQPDHVAALILHDAAGEPFAYQKAIGYPYAYVWRDSSMRTRAGLKRLLAGSIVRPIYDRDSCGQLPPHEKFAGVGLIGITGCVADDVEFKRFSVEVFPEKIRTASLLDASEPGAYGTYRRHVAETTIMNSTAFAGCMAELVKSTKTYCMAA
jgi:hypothetical protein